MAQVRGKKEVMFTFLRLLIISHAHHQEDSTAVLKRRIGKGTGRFPSS